MAGEPDADDADFATGWANVGPSHSGWASGLSGDARE